MKDGSFTNASVYTNEIEVDAGDIIIFKWYYIKILNNTSKMKLSFYATFLAIIIFSCNTPKPVVNSKEVNRGAWSSQKANTWYAAQPWYVGANFLPSSAINQLEMFRADSFDPLTIDREFGYAQSLGMNVMRVYLHDLLYEHDRDGFYKRLNTVLALAQKHGLKLMLTIFDSCWDPFPVWGRQRAPKPFVHNSGWVQSPGQQILKDPSQYPKLEKYVKDLVSTYKNDNRILVWDVWNEPDNMTGPSYEKVEIANKVDLVLPLLKKTFEWARSANPSQPLTSGVWAGNYESEATLKPIEKLQLEESDIISFHSYDTPERFEEIINQLKRYNKPMICSEYMARPNGSTFQGFLPIAKKHKIGMINWGFVDGKSQTIYPWDSWTKTYTGEPPLWFHDIFRNNGTPYIKDEVDFIKAILKSK